MESGNPLAPEMGPESLLGYTAGCWWALYNSTLGQ